MKGVLKMDKKTTVCDCEPNYKEAYYRHIEEIERLAKENKELKATIIGMAKWLFNSKEC